MDCSTPGLAVLHQLLELGQTHVHRVGDSIQPSHPLSSSLLLPSMLPSNRVFSNESVLHISWPKYWIFRFSISPSNEYSRLIFLRNDWLDLLAVQGTLKSLTPQFKSINSSVLSRGTGLYQVKTLVEGLGGKITVESQVGVGTSFAISFTQNV